MPNSIQAAFLKQQQGISIPAGITNVISPAITGSAQLGSVLNVSTGTWSGSGLTYTYQWRRNNVSIVGETNNTYTLVIADANTTITCVVTATNTIGSASATSNSLLFSATSPSNTVLPTISGATTVGSVLSSTTGTWTWSGGGIIIYSYQWLRNGVSIPSAASSSYTLTMADTNSNISCAVTATNSFGNTTVTSAATFIPGSAPVNTVAPSVTGATTIGSVLSSTTGTWTGTGTITYSYQWLRNGVNILGATSSSYILTVADDNTNISCAVTATNSVGNATATSAAVPITVTAPVNTVAPSVTGGVYVGGVLSSTTGTWTSQDPTITYAYQWKRNGVNISLATSSTYTITSADLSTNLTCSVTATNSVGSTTATSNTIAVPAAATLDPYASNLWSVVGFKRLLSTYGGNLLRVRRSSDNAEQDIGALFDGSLDTTSLLAFAGSGSAYVSKVYDQSGNGNDFAQAATTQQPRIVNAGVYDGFMYLDGVNDGLASVNLTPTVMALSFGMRYQLRGSAPGGGTATQSIITQQLGIAGHNSTGYQQQNNTGHYTGYVFQGTTSTDKSWAPAVTTAEVTDLFIGDRSQTSLGMMTLYRGGAAVSVSTSGGSVSSTAYTAENVYIGIASSGIQPAIMNFKWAAIWSTAQNSNGVAITNLT